MSKKLLKNSFIYVLGDVLNKAVPFFMLPVFTRYLTPEDYGLVAIFGVTVSILAVFVGLSVHGAVNVNFFRMSLEKLKEFIGNVCIILTVSLLLIFIVVLVFSPMIMDYIELPREWLMVAVVLAAAKFLTTINLVLWMAEQRPKPYSVYQISQTILTVGLSLTFVVGLGMNWQGPLLAQALGVVLFSLVSIMFIVKRGYFIFKPDKGHIVDALKFGVPLIPHALSGWVRTGADRVVLVAVIGSAATGLYAVGYQIATIILVFITAFHNAWTPFLMKKLSSQPSEQEKRKIVIFTYIYFAALLLMVAPFSLAIEYIAPYFLGERFTEASDYVFYLALAFAFKGMYLVISTYIFYVKKTHILAYVTFAAAVLHIGLLYYFISKYGATGAAMANAYSFAITFMLTFFLTTRIYKMPWLLGFSLSKLKI